MNETKLTNRFIRRESRERESSGQVGNDELTVTKLRRPK